MRYSYKKQDSFSSIAVSHSIPDTMIHLISHHPIHPKPFHPSVSFISHPCIRSVFLTDSDFTLRIHFVFSENNIMNEYPIVRNLSEAFCLTNYKPVSKKYVIFYDLYFYMECICTYSNAQKGGPRHDHPPFFINKIPNHILQVTKNVQTPEAIRYFMNLIPDSNYFNFTDAECIAYMKKYPIDGMTDSLIHKFNSFRTGAHKSDLFRYYWLYKNGGIYADQDLLLYPPIVKLIHQFPDRFISVRSIYKKTIFQGFIATPRHHPILLRALLDILYTPVSQYNDDYLLMTKQLYFIIKAYPDNKNNVLLLYEKNKMFKGYTDIFQDENHEIMARHFYFFKNPQY